jgi:hypothetical protein
MSAGGSTVSVPVLTSFSPVGMCHPCGRGSDRLRRLQVNNALAPDANRRPLFAPFRTEASPPRSRENCRAVRLKIVRLRVAAPASGVSGHLRVLWRKTPRSAPRLPRKFRFNGLLGCAAPRFRDTLETVVAWFQPDHPRRRYFSSRPRRRSSPNPKKALSESTRDQLTSWVLRVKVGFP